MRQFYVTVNGNREGPLPEPRLVAALNAGRWLDAAITDAETGEVVTVYELTHGGTQIITKGDATRVMERAPVGEPAQQFSQPFGDVEAKADYGELRTLTTTALVAALFCWPIGLPLAIVARSKAVNAGADTTRANWAIALNGLGLLLSFLQILKMLAAGEL